MDTFQEAKMQCGNTGPLVNGARSVIVVCPDVFSGKEESKYCPGFSTMEGKKLPGVEVGNRPHWRGAEPEEGDY